MSDNTDDLKTRHNQWFATAAFNTIALVGLNTQLNGDLSDQNKENKWCVSSMIITLIFAALGVFAHLLPRGKFVGTPIEGGLAVIILGFWASVLPAMMDPRNDIAQNQFGTIENANLYFFAWGAALMALTVMVGFMRDVKGIGAGKNIEFKPFIWCALMAASFVVMASATRLYKSYDCDQSPNDDTEFCSRTTFAFSIGAISGLLSLIWLVLGAKVPPFIDTIMGALMLVGWTFAVGYITFGTGPARTVGNLYFSTWASFISACALASSGMQTVLAKAGIGASADLKEEVKEEVKEGDEENVAAEVDAPADEENVAQTE